MGAPRVSRPSRVDISTARAARTAAEARLRACCSLGVIPPSVRDTARRSLLLLDDAVGLADGDGCPAAWRNGGGAWGVARARARLPYIPFDPIFLSFPLPHIIYPSTQGY